MAAPARVARAEELGLRGPRRLLQRGLGAVRAARRVPARGRPRRLGALRRPREPLRVPHAAARLLLGRPARRHDRGRRARRLVERRGLGRGVAPGDVDGWVDALESLLDDARRVRARAPRDRGACARSSSGRASSSRCGGWCASAGRRVPRRHDARRPRRAGSSGASGTPSPTAEPSAPTRRLAQLAGRRVARRAVP